MTDQNDLQNVLELVSFRNVVFTCSVVQSIRCMVQLLYAAQVIFPVNQHKFNPSDILEVCSEQLV